MTNIEELTEHNYDTITEVFFKNKYKMTEEEFEFLDDFFTSSLDEIIGEHLDSCVEHLIDMKKSQINYSDKGVWKTFEKFKDGELV